MTMQFSTAVRNARADVVEATIGASAVLKIFDDDDDGNSIPADPAAADVGTVLATLTLPSDWMAAAANGVKAKNGTWADNSADNTGESYYFRIYDSGVAACHIQGTVTATGGGGDMTVDNVNFAAGQAFSITGFTITEGNG